MLTITVIGTMGPLGTMEVPLSVDADVSVLLRNCDYCGKPYVVGAPHQRFCAKGSCRHLYNFHRIDELEPRPSAHR